MLLSGEDMQGCFHVFRLPAVWRKWFALSKPIHRRGDGGVLQEVWLTVGVVPMGWLSAVGIVQHIHRRLGGSVLPGAASIEETMELRRDLEFSLRLHPSPRWWWS
eukprot:7653761-Heterocapsa_arctica.AAC.1